LSELLKKYHGKYVAWNREGTRIVATGDDDLQAFNAALAAGYDPGQVVFSYVPFPDEVIVGGAELLPEGVGE
jgi:Family of unknown function (DUF5678)